MEISRLSRGILRDLCTNSRVTVTELAKKYGITRKMVKDRIDALESELGLKYTLELDYEKLGFAPPNIVRVKLKKKMGAAVLRSILARSDAIQFAVTTNGQFDMLAFVMVKTSMEYYKWEMWFWLALAKYGAATKSSEIIIERLGFVPMNDATIALSGVNDVYRKMLLALNGNSRMPISDLAGKVGMSAELAKYHVRKLNETGLIKRYTTVVTRPPLKHSIVYFANYSVKENVQSRIQNERRTMYFREPSEAPILNEFQMVLTTTGGDSTFTWAVYDDYAEGMERSVRTHERIYRADSAVARHAAVGEVVKGIPPIRSLDQKANYDLTILGDYGD